MIQNFRKNNNIGNKNYKENYFPLHNFKIIKKVVSPITHDL